MCAKKRRKKSLLPLILTLILVITLCGAMWFLFDSNVDRSGWKESNGNYYYLDFHGKEIDGWLEDNGCRYYFGPDHIMVTGWQEIDGRRYYFAESGVMATGSQTIDGHLYLFREDGSPDSGWKRSGTDSFYFFSDGSAAVSWQELGGNRFYFAQDGRLCIGWQEIDGERYYFDEFTGLATGFITYGGLTYYLGSDGRMIRGWANFEDGRHYFAQTGEMLSGWQTIDGETYYLGEDGTMQTGWLQDGEYRYYLREDGTMVHSPTVIDEEQCYFTPDGKYVLLVNYQNPVPKNYKVDLVGFGPWARVAAEIEVPLRRMINDCNNAGISCWLNCGFRSQKEQETILSDRTEEYQRTGLSYNQALAKALETVAVPGYSEHQIGYAVDVVCSTWTEWLMDHCWEYGFILRYPEDKADITGIVYEHWHFRYVGTEISMAMKDTGLCLEEYLGAA